MILIDGSNFCYRAHHTGANLSSRGRPTGVLHVGFSMLAALPSILPKQKMIFLWEGGKYWRREILPGYKKHSDEPNFDREAVYKQMDEFRRVLRAIGIAQLQVPGLEADDLAGILTTNLVKKNKQVILVSSDKDWLQLHQPGVRQIRGWKGKKGDWWDAARVKKEFGVEPARFHEYLALVGDDSDKIPKALGRGKGPAFALKVMASQMSLTREEDAQYRINLKVTVILREYDKSVLKKSLDAPKQQPDGIKVLDEVLSEYELFKLWGERDTLLEMGRW